MTPSGAGPAQTSSGETLLTKYLIFKVEDEGLVHLTRIGSQLARNSDDALRKFFETPLADNDGAYVPISENHAKPRRATARVKTTISNLEWPEIVDVDFDGDVKVDEVDEVVLARPEATEALPV